MNRTQKHGSRKRKADGLILAGILIAAVLFFYSAETLVKKNPGIKAPVSSGTAENGSKTAMEAIKTLAEQNPKAAPIVKDPGQYPERLLDSLAHNAELLDFTLDYPRKKGTSNHKISLSGQYRPGKIPLLMQWDENWGYASYGDGIIALDGCGPTCLSMVAVGLTGNTAQNPKAVADFSQKNGYLDGKTGGTLWSLMSDGAGKLGLVSREIPLDENRRGKELSQGHPIICSMRPGDFTTVGHFIVLRGYSDGKFAVNDPNSRIRSGKTWSYETLRPQIRNLWAFST